GGLGYVVPAQPQGVRHAPADGRLVLHDHDTRLRHSSPVAGTRLRRQGDRRQETAENRRLARHCNNATSRVSVGCFCPPCLMSPVLCLLSPTSWPLPVRRRTPPFRLPSRSPLPSAGR